MDRQTFEMAPFDCSSLSPKIRPLQMKQKRNWTNKIASNNSKIHFLLTNWRHRTDSALGTNWVHRPTSLYTWLFDVKRYSVPRQWYPSVDSNRGWRARTEFQNRYRASLPSCSICDWSKTLWSYRRAPFQWCHPWMLNTRAALRHPLSVSHKLNCISSNSTTYSCRVKSHFVSRQSIADSIFSICFGIYCENSLNRPAPGTCRWLCGNISYDRRLDQWQPSDIQLKRSQTRNRTT